MGLLDRLVNRAKSKVKSDTQFDREEYLRKRPGYESREELMSHELLTGDITTDSINFPEAMPDSVLKNVFMEQSSMTQIGTGGSGVKAIVAKLVGGFMTMAEQWFTWRQDDNYVTYFVRATLGLVLAAYVFYVLYTKHLTRYMNQVKHSLPYILDKDI